MTATPTAASDSGSPFKNRNFLLLFIAQAISSLGDALTELTLLILINKLTGSTTDIATLTVLIFVPSVVFGLFAGVIVDKFNRKYIMLASDLLRALLVFGFLFVKTKDDLILMFILSFLQAGVGTFFAPARAAVVQKILMRDQYMKANSMSQTSIMFANLFGGGLAGVIVGFTNSFAAAFIIDIFTFLISFGLVLFTYIPKLEKTEEEVGEKDNFFTSLKAGLQTLFSNPLLIAVILGASVTNFGLGASNVLLTPFIIKELNVPVAWLGAVEISQVAAAILSGLILAFFVKIKPEFIIPSALLVLGFAIGINTIVTSIVVYCIFNFIVKLAILPLNSSFGAIFQLNVKNELMGRAVSSFMIAVNSAMLLSMAFSGILARVVGIRNVFSISGAIILFSSIVTFLLLRSNFKSSVFKENEAKVMVKAQT
jgi:MFS family permease